MHEQLCPVGLIQFQKKVQYPPVGIELITLTITGLVPTLPICSALLVSDCQTGIKS